MLSSALHSGQVASPALWDTVAAFVGCAGALSSLFWGDSSGFFCSGFSVRVFGSLAGDILGETEGVVFGETLGTADIFGETCAGADILRDPGGVVRDSSWTADDIKVDAELKMEEPKPNIFPVMDSVVFEASGLVLGLIDPSWVTLTSFGSGLLAWSVGF